MNLALRPNNFDFLNQAVPLLQRDLLYFDQVHLCSFSKINALGDLEVIDKESFKVLRSELDYLKDKHLLFDFNLSEMMTFIIESSGIKKG